MPEDSPTLIGHLLDVQGAVFLADIIEEEEGVTPKVTIGDEDIVVGRLGSYVCVEQGSLRVIAMVTRMTEREKIPATLFGATEAAEDLVPIAVRTMQLVPVGYLDQEGIFERGITQYPTTGAEVHVVASPNLRVMFSRFQEKAYEVGSVSSNTAMRVCLDPSPLFGRHCAILGQTGAGKSWTVASLLQKAVSLMPRAHVILLDLHGEYRNAFAGNCAQVVNALSLEMPYWLMTCAGLCDLLIDRSELSAHNQTAFFRDTLNTLRVAEGERLGLPRTTVDTPVYFSLDELRTAILDENQRMVPGARNQPIKGPMHGDFDRFLMRLDSRMNDVRYDFLLSPRLRETPPLWSNSYVTS